MLFVLLVIGMKETSVEYFNMKLFDCVELKPPKLKTHKHWLNNKNMNTIQGLIY